MNTAIDSRQSFLEEYSTLSIIGDAGIGTFHMDGDPFLRSATAAMTMIESLGMDSDHGTEKTPCVCISL